MNDDQFRLQEFTLILRLKRVLFGTFHALLSTITSLILTLQLEILFQNLTFSLMSTPPYSQCTGKKNILILFVSYNTNTLCNVVFMKQMSLKQIVYLEI